MALQIRFTAFCCDLVKCFFNPNEMLAPRWQGFLVHGVGLRFIVPSSTPLKSACGVCVSCVMRVGSREQRDSVGHLENA